MSAKLFSTMLIVLSSLAAIDRASSIEPAAPVSSIINLREYTPTFASSGQLAAHHLEPLRQQGFERIVYIAYRAQGDASETLSIDRQATDLGLSYVHIPVPWQSPTLRDYQTFAAIMRSQPTMKTLLHCQMNYRASAFSFLYRVLELDTPMPTAAADLYQIWSPNSTWMTFINSVLVTNNRPILDTP